MVETKRPIGVSILSVLSYIGAGMHGILAILLLVGSSGGFLFNLPQMGALSAFPVIIGVILLGVAALTFFIARGLWKAQKWARIVLIIFSILGIISAISTLVSGSLTQGILNIVINGVIGGYLIFSKKVKTAFS